MRCETNLLVHGLADDHAAVRLALVTIASRISASVLAPTRLPETGFALVLMLPEPASAAQLADLARALAAELRERGVLHDELEVRLLDADDQPL